MRLYIAAVCIDAAAYGLFTLFPLLAKRDLDAGPMTLGFLGSVAVGVYGAMCLWTGKLSDRIAPRRLYFLGLALLLLVVMPSAWLTEISGSLTHLLITNALLGVALSLFWPPLEKELFDLSPGVTLWRSVGAFNCAWATGICIGSLAGPSLFDWLSFGEGIVFCGVVTGVAGVVLWRRSSSNELERTRGVEADTIANADTTADAEVLPTATGDPSRALLFLWLGWISNLAFYLAFHGLKDLLPWVIGELEFEVSVLALILLAINLPRLLTFLVLRRTRTWHYRLSWLVVLQLMGGATLLALGWATSPWWFVAALPIFGVFGGVSYFSSLFYGLDQPSGQGAKTGVHESMLALGQAIGPLLCGWFASVVPHWAGAAVFAAGAAVLLALVVELGLAALWARPRTR